jgi:histidinol-phosphatase (PHP family)
MDGKSTVSEMCISSVDAGMKEIAVTDHFEPCLREENVFYNAENYFLDIEKMRSVLNGKIKIRSGVELGQPHLYPDLSEKLINSHPYDYG